MHALGTYMHVLGTTFALHHWIGQHAFRFPQDLLSNGCREMLGGFASEEVLSGVADDVRGSAYLGCRSGAALRLRLSPLRLEARVPFASAPITAVLFRAAEGDLWFGSDDGRLGQFSARARAIFGLVPSSGFDVRRVVATSAPAPATRPFFPYPPLPPPIPPRPSPPSPPPYPMLYPIPSTLLVPRVDLPGPPRLLPFASSLSTGTNSAADVVDPSVINMWLSHRMSSEATLLLVRFILVRFAHAPLRHKPIAQRSAY